jgi:hypothetical protein
MSGRKRTIIDFLSPKVVPSSNPSPTPSTPVSPLNSKSNTPTKSTSMQIEIFEQEEPEIDVSFTGDDRAETENEPDSENGPIVVEDEKVATNATAFVMTH